MSVKQDRVAPRTAEDIERKYNFGRKFSEILGLIDESRDKVDSVESSLRNEIAETATTIMRDTESIVMEVARREGSSAGSSAANGALSEFDERLEQISSEVSLRLDADQVNIAIQQMLNQYDKDNPDSVEQVETTTGYRFDADGLSISKSGEEMTNLIDNTGMYVQRNGDNILAANDMGVEALNLHAKTYLIIGAGGGRSRLEDYGVDRTGVFWVG
jgi:pyridoxine 5'-phosphate synthase PdxJ